jgi:flagellar capping protein FliD
MKDTKRVIKRFDSHNAGIKIGALKRQAEQLKQVTELIQTITDSKHIKTVSEFQGWLNSKTKFQNAEFSADAMNLKDAYLNVIKMSKGIELTLEDVTAKFQLKPSITDKINESFTVYYSESELKTKVLLDEVIAKFNAIDSAERRKLIINRSYEMILNPMIRF